LEGSGEGRCRLGEEEITVPSGGGAAARDERGGIVHTSGLGYPSS